MNTNVVSYLIFVKTYIIFNTARHVSMYYNVYCSVTAVYFLAYGTEEQIYRRNGKIYFSHVLDKSFYSPHVQYTKMINCRLFAINILD